MGDSDFNGLYLNKDLQQKLRRYRITALAYILGGLAEGEFVKSLPHGCRYANRECCSHNEYLICVVGEYNTFSHLCQVVFSGRMKWPNIALSPCGLKRIWLRV